MSMKDLAHDLITGRTTPELLLGSYDLRKGKEVEDIKRAVQRGIKNGMGKTELEIDAVKSNLEKVLVKKK